MRWSPLRPGILWNICCYCTLVVVEVSWLISAVLCTRGAAGVHFAGGHLVLIYLRPAVLTTLALFLQKCFQFSFYRNMFQVRAWGTPRCLGARPRRYREKVLLADGLARRGCLVVCAVSRLHSIGGVEGCSALNKYILRVPSRLSSDNRVVIPDTIWVLFSCNRLVQMFFHNPRNWLAGCIMLSILHR